MVDTILRSLGGLRTFANEPVAVLIELLLIGLSVNWCASVLQGTRGTRPLRGVLTVLVVATLAVNILAAQLDWPRLALLYRYLLMGLAFIALVAFQPELRRAVIRAGDVQFRRRGTRESKVITALVQSARYLSKNRYGGLIAIQRAVDLGAWAEKGTLVNADVSANLLNSIFFPNSPLHDLGVIIAGNRVLAANCQLPVAESDEIGAALGSRHLAALGMSYESDALVLVVSEETGTISLADNGKLTRYLSIDDLADELTARLSGQPVSTPSERQRRVLSAAAVWQGVRRLLVVVPLTLVIWVLANQASQTEISGVDVQLLLRLNDPKQVVDVERPQPAVFKVTFRGTARAVDALRDYTADHPLRVDWVLNEPYPLRREQQRSAAALLDSLDAIRSRGLTVVDVSPPYLEFIVNELVTEPMPVGVKAGSARVVDLRTEPDRVSVTLRRRDLAQLLPAERVLLLPLEDRLRDAAPGQVLSLPAMRVPDRIRGFAIVGAEPREVSVTLRIEGRQATRRLAQIPVRLNVSPGFLERYDVKVVDEQEWLVEVEVEGDETKVAALRPADVKAFVTLPSDLLPQTPLHRADVEFSVPEGVTVLSQRSVQLRLTPRESPSP